MAWNIMKDNGLDANLIVGVEVMYINVFGTIVVDIIVWKYNERLIVSE